MKQTYFKRILAAVLTLGLLAGLGGCAAKSGSGSGEPEGKTPSGKVTDLMSGMKKLASTENAQVTDEGALAAADFAAELFKRTASGEKNPLLSPLSILTALAMTENGAGGETKTQMESVLGLSAEQWNPVMKAYAESLPAEEKCSVRSVNSVWFRDDGRFTPVQSFLQTNADWYDASVYAAPFDDATLTAINSWVSENTAGRIPTILSEIPDEAVMYLINALTFDAEWQNIYYEDQVQDGTFTPEGGEAADVSMMYGSEHTYLRDELAQGFLKYYAGQRYAFAAMLPDEGVSLESYIQSLTGEGLLALVENASSEKVLTAIPKFKSEYSVKLNDALIAMGMTDAFDPELADFAGLGTYNEPDGNVYISSVLHKTFIEVDEKGTKAGAATVVAMAGATAAPADPPKQVYLDRPFVYLIVDTQTGLPVFLGAVTEIGT